LLAAQETDGSIDLFDNSTPGNPLLVGKDKNLGCLGFDLNQAEGTLTRGLSIPLGACGVRQVSPQP